MIYEVVQKINTNSIDTIERIIIFLMESNKLCTTTYTNRRNKVWIGNVYKLFMIYRFH